jgi:Flp pilus assembly pilin Flp
MLKSIERRATDEAGQALIEYALIVSLISVIAVAALSLTGHSVADIIGGISNSV